MHCHRNSVTVTLAFTIHQPIANFTFRLGVEQPELAQLAPVAAYRFCGFAARRRSLLSAFGSTPSLVRNSEAGVSWSFAALNAGWPSEPGLASLAREPCAVGPAGGSGPGVTSAAGAMPSCAGLSVLVSGADCIALSRGGGGIAVVALSERMDASCGGGGASGGGVPGPPDPSGPPAQAQDTIELSPHKCFSRSGQDQTS